MTTQFLYNVRPWELREMLYYDALNYKLLKGKELYYDLYTGAIPNENDRLFWVGKALDHTRDLIAERINET